MYIGVSGQFQLPSLSLLHASCFVFTGRQAERKSPVLFCLYTNCFLLLNIEVFHKMLKEKTKPNNVANTADVISHCSQSAPNLLCTKPISMHLNKIQVLKSFILVVAAYYRGAAKHKASGQSAHKLYNVGFEFQIWEQKNLLHETDGN